jgi:hypothetical protein
MDPEYTWHAVYIDRARLLGSFLKSMVARGGVVDLEEVQVSGPLHRQPARRSSGTGAGSHVL